MECDPDEENVDMKTLYRSLSSKRKDIEKLDPIYLYQKDFAEGTYIINEMGHYVLKENIVFNPNPDHDYMPRPDQTKYKTPGFVLGFFAVISIAAEGVYLDLNGFTIKASKEFTLQQRFFSIIELANAPFLFSQGPGAFSTPTSFKPAGNTVIRNGKLGLSSHHGIHGNMATNILMEKLVIEDFEFVGVALNGCHSIIAHKVVVRNNRQDIPVLATYSAARFGRMFAKRVLNMPQLSVDQKAELSKRLTALEGEMNSTFKEVLATGKTSSKLFRNESGLADGNIYGFLVKNRGVAVDELISPDPSIIKTKNVFLRKVALSNLKCRVDEVLGLSQKGGLGVQNDAAGAVLQIDKIKDANGIYRGTVLSDLQLYLAELSQVLSMPLGKLNITTDTIEWSKSGLPIQSLLEKGYFIKIGGDSMAHQGKSAFFYRFDAIDNLILDHCSFYKIKNAACLGYDFPGCKMIDANKRNGEYPGAGAVGLNLAYCSNVLIHNFKGRKVFSKDGAAAGIIVMFGSENVRLDEIELSNIKAGTICKGKWLGRNYQGEHCKYIDNLPNKKPRSYGVKYQNGSIVDMKDVSVHDLRSCQDHVKLLKF